jgi:hypothetical protein
MRRVFRDRVAVFAPKMTWNVGAGKGSGVVAGWKEAAARYQNRVDDLGAPLIRLRDDLQKLPSAPLAYRPTELGLIKYQLCLLVSGGIRSACELVQSTQLLWRSGRFLSASLDIRLLMEIWGSLAFAESKVLNILDESGGLATVGPMLEKLLFGFKSGVQPPRGASPAVIEVTDFMTEAEAVLPGAMSTYKFLCDASHPTFVQYTYLLLAGANYDYWSDEKFAAEAHHVLGRALEGAETAVRGIEMVAYAIFRNALPVILAEARQARAALLKTEDDQLVGDGVGAGLQRAAGEKHAAAEHRGAKAVASLRQWRQRQPAS